MSETFLVITEPAEINDNSPITTSGITTNGSTTIFRNNYFEQSLEIMICIAKGIDNHVSTDQLVRKRHVGSD